MNDQIRWNFKLRKDVYVKFTKMCKKLGTTKAAVSRILIGEWLLGIQHHRVRRWSAQGRHDWDSAKKRATCRRCDLHRRSVVGPKGGKIAIYTYDFTDFRSDLPGCPNA